MSMKVRGGISRTQSPGRQFRFLLYYNSQIMKISTAQFQQHILSWYKKNGRHDLPWRHTKDPYAIMVSEIMLQQTQVSRVIHKWTAWMQRFPTLEDVARASVKEILDEWKGLGYNRRSLTLKKACEEIVYNQKSIIPNNYNKLISIPGIGSYTAQAIRAFAWNEDVVMIETNIRSVYIHHYIQKSEKVHDSEILSLIEKTRYKENPREWYYALMDYGSYLKKSYNPSQKSAHFTKQSSFKNSNREQRSFILDFIRTNTHTSVSEKIIINALRQHLGERLETNKNVQHYFNNIEKNITSLIKEGFIEKVDQKDNFYRIVK